MLARIGDYVEMHGGRKCTILEELETDKRSTRYRAIFDGSETEEIIEDFNIVNFLAGPTRETTGREDGWDMYVLDDSFDVARRLKYEFEDEDK